VLEASEARGWTLATAESCTGGLIAAALTAIPGSSAVVERGFVTYTNAAKIQCLGVPEDLFDAHGAVSGEVAEAMARGTLERAPVMAAVSVTGVAGPGGGTAAKPVGLVYLGIAVRGGAVESHRCSFDGDRDAVREASVREALHLLESAVGAA
jgi:nicotinamide-nucleotide amidase